MTESFNIAELDHECKVARNMVRRRRCKLRRYLASAILVIEIAGIQEIIIDYILTNRRHIGIIHMAYTINPKFPVPITVLINIIDDKLQGPDCILSSCRDKLIMAINQRYMIL